MREGKQSGSSETLTDGVFSLSLCHTLIDNCLPLLTFMVLALGSASAEVFNENLNLLACTRKRCRFIPRNPAAAYINQGHLQCCLQNLMVLWHTGSEQPQLEIQLMLTARWP